MRVRGWQALALGGSLGAGFAVARDRRTRTIETALADGPVTITRDRLGIPKVIAGSIADAMVGLGYALAEDRLWQMDAFRRTALGRLSEVAGAATLETDRLMRLLGIEQRLPDLLAEASDEGRAVLHAFAAGVNLRIERGALPLEFRVLRYRPEPWRPEDSLAILRLMGWSLSGFHEYDLVAELLRRTVGDEWTDAVFAGRLAESPVVVRDPAVAAGQPETSLLFPRHGASNAWAVAGARSMTGFPLLASDPHLQLANPSIWCEAAVEAPGLRVAGALMPGIPAVMIGRTPTFAWGLTAAMLPQTFVYREPHDVSLVAERVETIGVRGKPDERLVVRSTPRGPLFSDLDASWSDDPLSLWWTGMESGREFDALLALNRANSIDDALAARALVAVPTINIAAADTAGGIASMTVGRVALREARAGLLDPASHPPRYLPSAELPLERDPARGWIASANNPILSDGVSPALFGFFEPQFRIRRIADELESRPRHSLADTRALQTDVYSLHAAELAPLLAELAGDALPQWARDDLAAWDYQMLAESRAALVFETFYAVWTRRTLALQLPDDVIDRMLRHLAVGDVPIGFCDRLLRGEHDGWLGEIDRASLVQSCVGEALDWIAARLGDDAATWSWGRLHRLTLVHPFGERSDQLRRLLSVGPAPLPGDRTTVFPSGGPHDQLFAVGGGPSMRFVADLRRPKGSWLTNTLGQQGWPLSGHARDQFSDWLAGRMHPIWDQQRRRTVTIRPSGETR